MFRRMRRWCARRRVERFFTKIAHVLTHEDPAAEHYAWKIASQQLTRLHLTRERLAILVGVDAGDQLLLRLMRRTHASRRILLLSLLVSWFLPGVAAHRPALVIFGTPFVLIVGSSLVKRSIRRAARILEGAGEYPIEDFPYLDVRQAVRRHRLSVPAAGLGTHPHQALIAAYLGETDPEILEIAEKLSGEYAGTAVELLAASRRLL